MVDPLANGGAQERPEQTGGAEEGDQDRGVLHGQTCEVLKDKAVGLV